MARSVTDRDCGSAGSSAGGTFSVVAFLVVDGVAARDAFMLQRSPSSATAAGCLLVQHDFSATGALVEQQDDFVAFAAS
jgi:hypothetical protein